MKTPAGNECSYFYGDYYRGRKHEECRLLGATWKPSLCRTCPVPMINRSNACKYMRLQLKINRSILTGFKPRVIAIPFCEKTGRSDFDPHIGCGECHLIPPVFTVEDRDP